MTEDSRPRLQALWDHLMELHRAVVQAARTAHEAVQGPTNATAFLHLLTDDPAFAWLKPFTRVVLDLDILLDGKAALPAARLPEMQARVIALLDREEAFVEHYSELLQTDPEIAGLHAELRQLLSAD